MRKFTIGLAFGLLFAFGLSVATPRFRVGIGRAPSGHLFAATASAGVLTVALQQITVNDDGSALAVLTYASAGGSVVVTRTLIIPASSAKPITDQYGNVIAAGGTWSAYATAISTFASSTDTTIASAAAGGKLNL